jgi:hypothetical protein
MPSNPVVGRLPGLINSAHLSGGLRRENPLAIKLTVT